MWKQKNEKRLNVENETAQSKVIPSLTNVCADPLTNKDAEFFNALQDAFSCELVSSQ